MARNIMVKRVPPYKEAEFCEGDLVIVEGKLRKVHINYMDRVMYVDPGLFDRFKYVRYRISNLMEKV